MGKYFCQIHTCVELLTHEICIFSNLVNNQTVFKGGYNSLQSHYCSVFLSAIVSVRLLIFTNQAGLQ